MSDTTNPEAAGKTTTEWTVTKWITWICGVLATVLSGVLASGVIDNPTAQTVLGAAVAILAAVGGVAVKTYIDGRSNLKLGMIEAAMKTGVAKAQGAVDPTQG